MPKPAGSWISYVPVFAVDLAGRMAPNSMTKRGVLVMEGVRRWVALEKGTLRIFADESGTGSPMLEASMMYVEVLHTNGIPGHYHLAPFAPTELRLTVEPEALNHAVDRGRGSMPVGIVGVGVGPVGGGMLNPAPTTTELSGDVKRVSKTLFADSPAEKMAWVAVLGATSHGRRQWAHARHEASITMNAARESMGTQQNPRRSDRL